MSKKDKQRYQQQQRTTEEKLGKTAGGIAGDRHFHDKRTEAKPYSSHAGSNKLPFAR